MSEEAVKEEVTEIEPLETFDDVVDETSDEGVEDWDDLEEAEEVLDDEPTNADKDVPSEEPVKDAVETPDEDGPVDEKAEEDVAKEDGKDAEAKEDVKDGEKEVKEGEEEKKEEPVIEIFKVKVDGEEQDVTLNELKENYSGKVAYDKKFSELDGERKNFSKEVEEINAYVNEFGRLAREGKGEESFTYLAQFAGIPAYQVREMLINELTPEIVRRSSMTANELSGEQLDEQNKYLKDQNESLLKKREDEQVQTDLNNSIGKIRETQSINREEWDNANAYLKDQVESDKLTPELVGNFITHERAYNRAESLLDSLDGTLKSNDELVNSVHKVIIDNPTWDDNDVNDVIRQGLGLDKKEAEAKLTEKIAKKEGNTAPKETKKAQIEEDIEDEIIDWDEL